MRSLLLTAALLTLSACNNMVMIHQSLLPPGEPSSDNSAIPNDGATVVVVVPPTPTPGPGFQTRYQSSVSGPQRTSAQTLTPGQ